MTMSLTRGATLGRSTDELDLAGTQTHTFWDIGNYRKVVRMIDDGAKLCFDLVKMTQERAEIEAKYSKNLHQWSKKWEDLVNKGPEYGATLQNGWKTLLHEASRQADIHDEVSKKVKELSKAVTKWQSFHYHKTLSGRWKESKTAEEGFHSAQKPWEKCLTKCNKTKKVYHHNSQDYEAVVTALEDVKINPVEIEQLQKLRERREKIDKERDKSKEKYQIYLTEIFHDKDRYIREMKAQFEKCQVFEKIRLEFFKDTLIRMKGMVDLSRDERVPCIYQVCDHTLSQINTDNDQLWYNQNYGPDMIHLWPIFEEFNSPENEPQGITLSIHSSNYSLNSSQRLSDGYQSLDGSQPNSPLHELVLIPDQGDSDPSAQTEETLVDIMDHIYESTDHWPGSSSPLIGGTLEDFTENKQSIPVEGILMRALYEYNGVDEDDLSFKEGDVIRFLEYCNGGWAKALLGEEYGYVPEAYFEPIV